MNRVDDKDEDVLGALIEPQQPVLTRDGRTFDLGSKARSLPWIYPSVTAGCVRSLIGRLGEAPVAPIELQQVTVKGPFLALPANDPKQQPTLLLAAPRDAFPSRYEDEKLVVKRLPFLGIEPAGPVSMREKANRWFRRIWPSQQELPNDSVMTKDDVSATLDVTATGAEKPAQGLAYWTLDQVANWLLRPAVDEVVIAPLSSVQRGLPNVTRTHVSMRNEHDEQVGGVAQQVFQTVGLDFTDDEGRAVAIACEVRGARALVRSVRDPVPTTLGGERRAVFWSPMPDHGWARPNSTWTKLFADACRLREPLFLRMLLITPASFEHGHLPGWIRRGQPVPGTRLRLKLEGIANERWQGVSGWDMVTRRPRPGRRLVPAGSVYLFRVLSGTPDLEDLWMRAVSDDEQARRDGFGISLWGTA